MWIFQAKERSLLTAPAIADTTARARVRIMEIFWNNLAFFLALWSYLEASIGESVLKPCGRINM